MGAFVICQFNSYYKRLCVDNNKVYFIGNLPKALSLIKQTEHEFTFIGLFISHLKNDLEKLFALLSESQNEKITVLLNVDVENSIQYAVDIILLVYNTEYSNDTKNKIMSKLCSVVKKDELLDNIKNRYIFSNDLDFSFYKIIHAVYPITDDAIIEKIFSTTYRYDDQEMENETEFLFSLVYDGNNLGDAFMKIYENRCSEALCYAVKYAYYNMQQKFDETFLKPVGDELNATQHMLHCYMVLYILKKEIKFVNKNGKLSDFFKDIYAKQYNFTYCKKGYHDVFRKSNNVILEFIYDMRPVLGKDLLDGLSDILSIDDGEKIVKTVMKMLSENQLEIQKIEKIASIFPELLLFLLDNNFINLEESGKYILKKYIENKKFEKIPFIEVFKNAKCVYKPTPFDDIMAELIYQNCNIITNKIKSYCDDHVNMTINIFKAMLTGQLKLRELEEFSELITLVISNRYLLETELKQDFKKYLSSNLIKNIRYAKENNNMFTDDVLLNLLFEDDTPLIDVGNLIEEIIKDSDKNLEILLERINEKYPEKINRDKKYVLKRPHMRYIFEKLKIPFELPVTKDKQDCILC